MNKKYIDMKQIVDAIKDGLITHKQAINILEVQEKSKIKRRTPKQT